VVRFPNGTLPVAEALVYVPRGAPDDVPRSSECGECLDSGALAAYATTGVDGTFTLRGVAEGEQTVVVEKGLFRRSTTLRVTACTDNPLDPSASRLPASPAEGLVPRIAVVTGDFDRMEDVLSELGLAADTFDLHEGSSEALGRGGSEEGSALLADRTRLMGYDIVFVDCGALVAEPSFHAGLDAAMTGNLRAFVEDGGRLYVTDNAYDLVEQSYPQLVDFQEGGAGLTTSAEMGDAAQIGDELRSVSAMVHDDTLREWLVHTGAVPASGSMTIRGFLSGWTVIDSVDEEHAKVWTSADVSWTPFDFGAPGSGVRPLTVTFEAGCGRTLFTSYHTVPEERGTALTAQEQTLAYLVLEIGACIEEPSLI